MMKLWIYENHICELRSEHTSKENKNEKTYSFSLFMSSKTSHHAEYNYQYIESGLILLKRP